MMQTQLAERLDVGKASLGNLIDRLEADGWVKRRADPVDKRAKRVYLARNAEQLLDAMMNYERKFNEQALRGLNDEDRDSLVRLLSLIKQSLSNIVPSDSLPDED